MYVCSYKMYIMYVLHPAHASKGSRRVVKALCGYAARADTDISFRKGDRMEVLSDTEPDWWRVLHLTSRLEGLVPVNFVAEESSVESEEWVISFNHLYRFDGLYSRGKRLLTCNLNVAGSNPDVRQ